MLAPYWEAAAWHIFVDFLGVSWHFPRNLLLLLVQLHGRCCIMTRVTFFRRCISWAPMLSPTSVSAALEKPSVPVLTRSCSCSSSMLAARMGWSVEVRRARWRGNGEAKACTHANMHKSWMPPPLTAPLQVRYPIQVLLGLLLRLPTGDPASQATAEASRASTAQKRISRGQCGRGRGS